jgi:PrgI family protein
VASYQIPQFLDSGDKIIFGMNLRQFGYALGAALISVAIFTLVNQASPGIGFYAIIPCLPFIGVGSYLALGRFNGRDSEIYVLKFLLYNTKPKSMVYTRFPVIDDLNDKLATLNYNAIVKTWTDRINTQKAKEQNSFIDFNAQGNEEKIRKIQSLRKIVDENPLNAIQTVLIKEQELARTQQIIESSIQAKRNTPFRNNPVLQQPFNPFPVQPRQVLDTTDPDIPTNDATQANFFQK